MSNQLFIVATHDGKPLKTMQGFGDKQSAKRARDELNAANDGPPYKVIPFQNLGAAAWDFPSTLEEQHNAQ